MGNKKKTNFKPFYVMQSNTSLFALLFSLGFFLLCSTSAVAEFKYKETWYLIKDIHLLGSAARQLSRVASKDAKDNPIAIQANNFRSTVKSFTQQFRRRQIFSKKPESELIKLDFGVVKESFHALRNVMKKEYREKSMSRIRIKFDKLIYRYHRVRHSIEMHATESKP